MKDDLATDLVRVKVVFKDDGKPRMIYIYCDKEDQEYLKKILDLKLHKT